MNEDDTLFFGVHKLYYYRGGRAFNLLVGEIFGQQKDYDFLTWGGCGGDSHEINIVNMMINGFI